MEEVIIITNNPMSRDKLSNKHKVDFIEGAAMEVYTKVRDYIHKGHKLLTHPLMSSIKPNETPYRTIVISKDNDSTVDIKSLGYIEEAVHTTEKFLKNYGLPNWSKQVLEDFQLIDYDLIYHALT
ncbi:GrdX protein [Clostridium carboxidivorans P7]|uniref:GrdX protein n=2 Tax=Clostridium TaxID=1485 RepID=C6PSC0_9CLOT|nr:GrdX protein [Clostridium carboxidivorans P7]EET87917.1 GrdX protein [Clostridium carboxidivorans P7]EFG89249.1 GrdX family protein [Clostridium carboxidivorans P7]